MSEAAAREREVRQHWAQPGSQHDRVIRFAKIGLPVAVGRVARLALALDLEPGEFRIALVAEEQHLLAVDDDDECVVRDLHGHPFRLFPNNAVSARMVANPAIACGNRTAHSAGRCGSC
jgi:lipopolysaccharide export system protein LptC